GSNDGAAQGHDQRLAISPKINEPIIERRGNRQRFLGLPGGKRRRRRAEAGLLQRRDQHRQIQGQVLISDEERTTPRCTGSGKGTDASSVSAGDVDVVTAL